MLSLFCDLCDEDVTPRVVLTSALQVPILAWRFHRGYSNFAQNLMRLVFNTAVLIPAFCLLAGCGKNEPAKEQADAGPSSLAAPTLCGDPHRIVIASARRLPAPPLRDGIGDATMKITTRSGEAQAYFDNGLNLLHAFWEFEAYRAFLRATQLDPDCAMAYWGIVLCMPGANPEFIAERNNAMKRLNDLKPAVSAKEQAYIAALQTLVSQGTDAFAPQMEAIWRSDPEDVNAGAFAAYYYKEGYSESGMRTDRQERAVKLIEEVLAKHPNHAGALHYAMHIYELGPEIERARPLGEKLAKLAPHAGHMVHMPGHVAYFTGDYEAAIAQFRAADAVDRAYLEKEGIEPAENENFAHNLHFLALAYAEAGRLKESLLYAEELRRVRIASTRLRSEASSVVAYEGRSLAGRLLLRAGLYQKAAEVLALEALDVSPSTLRYYLDGLKAVARGLHAAQEQRVDDARIAFNDLARYSQLMNDSGRQSAGREEQHYVNRAVRILDLFARLLRAHTASSVETGRIFVRGIVDADAGGYRMDPPILPLSAHELVGAYFLAKNDAAAAKEAFEKALIERPKSGYVLTGLARAEKLAGNAAAASAAYQKALAAWPKADDDLAGYREARAAAP